MARITVYHDDNLNVLKRLASGSVDLIYIDPPFNTGKVQSRKRLRMERDDESGDRTGFGGRRYRTEEIGELSFHDKFDDFIGFLAPRMEESRRILKAGGSVFLHLDYHEVHYAKVFMDTLFGRESFINEIIWSYDYGARSKTRWSPKHDNILWYAKDPENYKFNLENSDRLPYMAPKLCGPEKAARGKTPTDSWWHTIVSPNGREKNGYPTQKPLGILERIVKVHSDPGDMLMDFFAGSGSFGEAALRNGRDCILVDSNPEAIEVMRRRFPSGARFLSGADGAQS